MLDRSVSLFAAEVRVCQIIMFVMSFASYYETVISGIKVSRDAVNGITFNNTAIV